VKNRRGFRWLRDMLCGCLIGAGAILPGVSGGVLAVVFGLYQPMMEILTEPRRAIRLHGWRFVPVLLGICAGFLVFAKGLLAFFHISPTVAVWAFIGLILGTMPALFREAGARGRTMAGWMSLLLCGAFMLAGLWMMGHGAFIEVTPGFGWYSVCGFLIGVGMVVPGLTTSALLMSLGLYEPMLEALAALNWQVLLLYVPSTIATVVLLARFVRWLFQRYYTAAYHGIIGIVAASTVFIIPLQYQGVGEMLCCGLCCVLGFALAAWMARQDAQM